MSRPPSVSWPGAPWPHARGQQDHPGAGAQRRHPARDSQLQWLEQVEGAGQLGHCGGLPAREYECVTGVELRRSSYGLSGEAEGVQRPEVLANVALERENADGQGVAHQEG